MANSKKEEEQMKWMMHGMKIASALKPVPGTGGGVLHGGMMDDAMKAVIKQLQTHRPKSLDKIGILFIIKEKELKVKSLFQYFMRLFYLNKTRLLLFWNNTFQINVEHTVF